LTEQFENFLFDDLRQLKTNLPIFIEDESSMLGNVKMPDSFYNSLQHAPMLFIEKDRTKRLAHLLETYSKNQNKEAVKAAFNRISKRLGGLQLQQSLKAVDEDNAKAAVDIALTYYDKNYYKKLNSRLFSRFIKVDGNTSNEHIAYRIAEKTKLIYG